MSMVRINDPSLAGTTLDICHAILIELEPEVGACHRAVIAWRDRPRRVRPVPMKRLRDLRPREVVCYGQRTYRVLGIEVWR